MKTIRLLVLAMVLAACADDAPAPAADAPVDSSRPADSADVAPAAAARTDDPVVAAWLSRVDSTVYTRWGACPFECCVYRDWVAEEPVLVRAQPDSMAPVLATVPAGGRFQADTGFVRITAAQLVVVTAPVEAYAHEPGRRDGGRPDSLAAGDTLLVLEYLGEGHVMMTHGDDLVSAEQFWPTADGWTPFGGPKGRVVGEHRAEWWAHVRTAEGVEGWIDAYRSELGNVDACGVPA